VTKSEEKASNACANWHYSDYAQQYYARERPFLNAGLRQSVGPCVLQIGQRLDQSIVDDLELPYLLKADFNVNDAADTVLDPAFLPFAPDSFSTVILPHVLETHGLHHQLLREAHRVLQNEGHIVLTGFNPNSLVGLQRFIRPSAACVGHYYSVRRVIDWLQLLGFEVVASSMFQYAPLSKGPGFRRAFNFLESVGNRWLPMTGGGYMISAKKRDVEHTMVGRLRYKKRRSKLVAAATATKVAMRKSTEDSIN
jgi:SAM-dependent methyltransferase